MSAACVLVAAGSGTRLAAGTPKAFVLLDGRPLLAHAADRVLLSGACTQLVLVVPAGREAESLALVGPAAAAAGCVVAAVAGGADRRSSVRAGLGALDVGVDVVLVHDAARCLTPAAQVAAVAGAVLAGHDVVVPGLAVTDTVRSVEVDTGGGRAGSLLDREALRLVQTPQGFRRDVLERAHAAAAAPGAVPAALTATDDATLAELLGASVHLVPGHEEALKVTRPVDLVVAGALLGAQRAAAAVGVAR